MSSMTGLRVGLSLALTLIATDSRAQVEIADVEQFYQNAAVFSPAEPSAHAYATRYPSMSASGARLAYARAGQNQIMLRNLPTGGGEVIAAPGLLTSGRDFTLGLDGLVLIFAADPPTAKSSCGRQLFLRNIVSGSQSGTDGAGCLGRPSKPATPQLDQPYGYASNVRPSGGVSPSNSYDLYFRRRPPPGGKGDAEPDCLTCAQDPNDSGSISVASFSAEPVSNIAHRDNKNVWVSPDGGRIAFVFSIAYARCAAGNADCGESGLVIADVTDAGVSVRRSLRITERNRFLDVHGSADGNDFVLSTSAQLLPEDINGGLDVYHFDVSLNRLTLLSGGLTGSASDPRIAGNGRYAVFSTDSIGRTAPSPLDVDVVICTANFDPVTSVSRYYLVDLQGAAPRRAQVLQESQQFSNACNASSAAPREGADINHSGTRLALTTRTALAAGDSNGAEDVYVVANRFARDLVFDHSFD